MNDDAAPTVDIHAHAVVGPALALAMGHEDAAPARAQEAATFGEHSSQVNQQQIQTIVPLLTDPAARLEVMDRQGIDVQLVSPSPQHYHDWADERTSRQIVELVNHGMAELVGAHPQRLRGLGLVSLHRPQLAVDQLTHAISELGLHGVEISTSAGERELTDPSLEPFWARAEELDALVFIHPWGSTLGPRLNRHYLANIVGNPTETTLALSHIIFDGLLDRRPRLRILGAHGGGYLPFYIGRSDHAWEVRPDSQKAQRAPSEYLRRLYFDDVVFQPHLLEALVAQVGAGQVLMGTDYPFDMGHWEPLERVGAATALSAEDRARITGANAAQLLGLTAAATP
jgi:aminocarboxymuconate-semialdehyde decarboxylase